MVKIEDYKSGSIIFVMYMIEDEEIKYAKEFCEENNLTSDQVSVKIRRIKNEKTGEQDKFLLVMVK